MTTIYWHSAAEFFHMGGYGLYVWGSYGLSLAWMLAEPWLAARRRRRALSDAVGAEVWDAPAEGPGAGGTR